jgi:2-polyprenyl-3-methyl-5-hydroxy-6-metoxy-1,4-benzoquinol methylase
MQSDSAIELAERVLGTCGGGRFLVVGTAGQPVVRALRRRAVEATAGTFESLGSPGTYDVIVITDGLEQLPQSEITTVIDQLRRLLPRAAVLRVTGTRADWETRFIEREWRRHPMYQSLLPVEPLRDDGTHTLLMQPLPSSARTNRNVKDLTRARELRMDMLRDAGPRADAHVARYEFAKTLIRPGDRVLDASCGLGYGSALLAEGTLAESILGVDVDEAAIRYASEHYSSDRKRLKFERRDLSTIGGDSRSTFDLILCFDTIEHLANPAQFLAECQRLLTPGGRFVGSIATATTDAAAVNEHHLHIFTRPVFEQLCKKYFEIEQVCGQTAVSISPSRAIWKSNDSERAADWWVVVGMTDPFLSKNLEFRHGLLPTGAPQNSNLVAFERDYDRPWLLRTLISLGFRTDAASVLERMARRSILASTPTSADRGAALCVRAYLTMDRAGGIDGALMDQIEKFCTEPASSPTASRWQVSLRYAQALALLDAGEHAQAVQALEQCAQSDPLIYNPLLATKTVSAAWLLGWIALQRGDRDRAKSWWTQGISGAERALQRPWEELLVSWTSPVVFGLRDAALVVDLASQCAAGLHLLPHAMDRPGIVAAQLAESMGSQLERYKRDERIRRAETEGALDTTPEVPSAAPKKLPRATALLRSPLQQVPSNLKVAIFGVGGAGADALVQLRRRGATVACFSDANSMMWYDKLEGLPIVAPAALRARKIDIIAVAGEDTGVAFAQLERLGYQQGQDFDAIA